MRTRNPPRDDVVRREASPRRPAAPPARALAAVLAAAVLTVTSLTVTALSVLSAPALASQAATEPDAEFTLSGTPHPALLASANELWLRQMYDVILRRVPDTPGLDYWLGRIASGGDDTRINVSSLFLFSTEGSQGEVDRAYLQLLGRAAEPGGRAFWTAYLTTYPVTVLRSNLLASDEILNRSGSIEAWLDLVYRELLGRGADEGGRAYWAQRAREGMARYSIVAHFYYSPENLGRRVDTIYGETLGRGPSPAEREAGSIIVANQDERRLRVLALAGDEYFQQYLTTAGGPQ